MLWGSVGVGTLSLLVTTAVGVSARWNWWRSSTRGLPILMYHKIGTPPKKSLLKKLWVREDRFYEQMDYLARHGYSPIRFQDVVDFLDGRRGLPENPVVITFDDGYKNNYTLAFPILKEFGFSFVIFLVVRTLGKENAWHNPDLEPRVPMLSVEQVKIMHSEGVEFESHTLNHLQLSRLSQEEADVEISGSYKELTELLGRSPVAFSYPYGDGADIPIMREMAIRAGYKLACSIHQGKADVFGNLFSLQRILVRRDDNLWDFHLNLTRGRSRF